jgi:hypothetical protein
MLTKKLSLSETINRMIKTVSFILAMEDGEHLFAKPKRRRISGGWRRLLPLTISGNLPFPRMPAIYI